MMVLLSVPRPLAHLDAARAAENHRLPALEEQHAAFRSARPPSFHRPFTSQSAVGSMRHSLSTAPSTARVSSPMSSRLSSQPSCGLSQDGQASCPTSGCCSVECSLRWSCSERPSVRLRTSRPERLRKRDPLHPHLSARNRTASRRMARPAEIAQAAFNPSASCLPGRPAASWRRHCRGLAPIRFANILVKWL
jgi:hypothetical protein